MSSPPHVPWSSTLPASQFSEPFAGSGDVTAKSGEPDLNRGRREAASGGGQLDRLHGGPAEVERRAEGKQRDVVGRPTARPAVPRMDADGDAGPVLLGVAAERRA